MGHGASGVSASARRVAAGCDPLTPPARSNARSRLGDSASMPLSANTRSSTLMTPCIIVAAPSAPPVRTSSAAWRRQKPRAAFSSSRTPTSLTDSNRMASTRRSAVSSSNRQKAQPGCASAASISSR